MKILIIGSGGREHALAHALSRSPHRPELFIAPGNAGTSRLGRNVPIAAEDVETLRDFAVDNGVDLTIVGPEQPLVRGIVDLFIDRELDVVGPTAAAARLEGSKAFAKAFMARHKIPTADYRTFNEERYEDAAAYLEEMGAPVVLKASGLAAGKGAIVCETQENARSALDLILVRKAFGEAGRQVIIEEFMEGEEASVFVLADGERYVTLAAAQDHKRIGEGDTGPNTGGMGAYAPARIVSAALHDRVARTIIEPVLHGMASEGHPYTGILYCGLMLTAEGPRVVEFNCRLGDPEAQVVLPLLRTDAVEVFSAAASGRLGDLAVEMLPGAAACVVMASDGYPGNYRKGFPIDGLDEAEALEGVAVYQAGSSFDERGRVVTDGGRVLGVTGIGPDLETALGRAYAGVGLVHFQGARFRRDIGQRGLGSA